MGDSRGRVLGGLTLRRGWPVAVFLSLLFAAGFLVRVWGMSKFHFWDEMVYLQDGLVICCGKTNYSELEFRPPLLSVMFAGVFLFWPTIYAACVVTAVANALGPVFLFFAGRLAVGRRAAALASVLLALGPFFVGVFPNGFDSDDTGNSLLTDSPGLTLLILSLWLLLRAMRRPTRARFFWAGVSLAMCILMRFGAIPSVGMLLLLPLVSERRWKGLAACVAGLAAGMASYLIWAKVTFGGFLATIGSAWTHVEGPVQPFTFFLRNAATIFTPMVLVGLGLIAGYEVYSAVRGFRAPRQSLDEAPEPIPPKQSLDGAPGSWRVRAFLLVWLVCGFVFFSRMPHKEPRYILPLAAPVLLLGSAGLMLFTQVPQRAARVAATVCLGAALVWTFLPVRERFDGPFVNRGSPDEELASRFLTSHVPAGTTLWMSFNYPAFAFYTDFRIHELGSVGPELYRDMEQIPPGEVLIVYREAEDPSQADVGWADRSGKFKRIAEYPTMVVYRRV